MSIRSPIEIEKKFHEVVLKINTTNSIKGYIVFTLEFIDFIRLDSPQYESYIIQLIQKLPLRIYKQQLIGLDRKVVLELITKFEILSNSTKDSELEEFIKTYKGVYSLINTWNGENKEVNFINIETSDIRELEGDEVFFCGVEELKGEEHIYFDCYDFNEIKSELGEYQIIGKNGETLFKFNKRKFPNLYKNNSRGSKFQLKKVIIDPKKIYLNACMIYSIYTIILNRKSNEQYSISPNILVLASINSDGELINDIRIDHIVQIINHTWHRYIITTNSINIGPILRRVTNNGVKFIAIREINELYYDRRLSFLKIESFILRSYKILINYFRSRWSI